MLPVPPVLAIAGLGATELAVIILILVLLFGAAKIPQLARSLGKAKGEFEKGLKDGKKEAAEEDRVRQEAADLGIDTEGKSVDELKAAIAERRNAA